jgi:uncharacterized low-complexity protein
LKSRLRQDGLFLLARNYFSVSCKKWRGWHDQAVQAQPPQQEITMKNRKTTLILATGAALTVAAISSAHAADNPFGMQKLDSGYQLAQAGTDGKKADGKCGEAKCGAAKAAEEQKKKEAAVAGEKKKDGSCGGDKKKDAACGAKK